MLSSVGSNDLVRQSTHAQDSPMYVTKDAGAQHQTMSANRRGSLPVTFHGPDAS